MRGKIGDVVLVVVLYGLLAVVGTVDWVFTRRKPLLPPEGEEDY